MRRAIESLPGKIDPVNGVKPEADAKYLLK